MSNLAIRLLPETLRSLAFGSISGTYAGIGTSLSNPARILILQNLTDVTLTYSWDGLNDHMVLPSQGQVVLDVTTNKSDAGGVLAISQGQRIYVKGAPASGSTYLSVFYGANG